MLTMMNIGEDRDQENESEPNITMNELLDNHRNNNKLVLNSIKSHDQDDDDDDESNTNTNNNNNRSEGFDENTNINTLSNHNPNSNSKTSSNNNNNNNRFSNIDILSSIDHPHTLNNKSLFSYYFYTNTTTILNKFIMSYEEQMHKAIVKGNYELCKELIVDKSCDVNKQVNKRYALGLACEYNYIQIVELLIKHGANLNQFDYYDQSALIYAVSSADLNVIKLMVKFGADVNKPNSNGVYPLHLAISRQDDNICNFLLEHGANINACDNLRYSPLSMAISNDYFYLVDKLIALGADTNIADNNGDTPLIKSIWLTMSSVIDKERIIDLVIKLVEAGADVNAKNETGRTALFTAIYQNNTDIAMYLIENGAKCELEDSLMSNFTLLHYACFQGNFTLVKTLLEKKCDPNSIATSCESPVYIAVTKGYVDIVDLLVQYGADVNILIGTDCDNKCTALQAALYYISDYTQFKLIVDKLIKGNANLNIEKPGPILYICLQYNKLDFAKYLVSVGASVDQRTVFNQSCFYKAFLLKNLEFMQMCVMAGFCLYDEPWINEYLDNPDFIEYTDYYVKLATSSNGDDSDLYASDSDELDSTNSTTELGMLMQKSDQELNDLLNLDEYYFERFHLGKNNKNKNGDKNKQAELAKKIYYFIRYNYTNPLSLKELARIQVRKTLLSVDHKMKYKIENDLVLPKRLKDYLLMKEFAI